MGPPYVTSTKVKVNADRAREVLRKYALRDVQFLLDEAGYLQAVRVGPDDWFDGWPRAVPAGELPQRTDYADEQAYWDDLDYTYGDAGEEGFTALLRELATCIEAPLMILAVGFGDSRWCSSCVWRVEPGAEQPEELSAYAVDRPGG